MKLCCNRSASYMEALAITSQVCFVRTECERSYVYGSSLGEEWDKKSLKRGHTKLTLGQEKAFLT